MSCEAGVRASIHLSKAPSFLGKRPHNVRFSPLILAHKGSAPTPLVRGRSSYPPSSPNLVCAHPTDKMCSNMLVRAAASYRAFRDNITCLSRATCSRRTPYWRYGGRTGRNRPDTTRLPPLVNQPAGSGRYRVGVTSRGRVRP